MPKAQQLRTFEVHLDFPVEGGRRRPALYVRNSPSCGEKNRLIGGAYENKKSRRNFLKSAAREGNRLTFLRPQQLHLLAHRLHVVWSKSCEGYYELHLHLAFLNPSNRQLRSYLLRPYRQDRQLGEPLLQSNGIVLLIFPRCLGW